MEIKETINNYKSNSHFVYNCKFHIIFCPKYRRKVLKEKIQIRLKDLLDKITKDYKSEIIEIEIFEDHVHLILDCDPSFGVTKLIREMKGISSKILREEFPELKTKLPTLWTRSAFISTVGSVSLEVVKKYIQDQKGK